MIGIVYCSSLDDNDGFAKADRVQLTGSQSLEGRDLRLCSAGEANVEHRPDA
jgi:hypothetical protein